MNDKIKIPEFGLYGETGQYPDLMHCEAIFSRASEHNWRIKAHYHSQMAQLFMIFNGASRAVISDTEWQFSNEAFLFIPANYVHEFDFDAGTDGLVFSFPLVLMRSIGSTGSDVLGRLETPFIGAINEELSQLAPLLRLAYEKRRPFRQQSVISLSHAILTLLAETQVPTRTARSGPRSDRLNDLDDLIAQHSAKSRSPAHYAAKLGLSTGHLSRLCRDATGIGASAYIERKIMNEACRLLAFTRLPASQIGYRLGYNDPSYFSKRFSHTLGISPTKYRTKFDD